MKQSSDPSKACKTVDRLKHQFLMMVCFSRTIKILNFLELMTFIWDGVTLITSGNGIK